MYILQLCDNYCDQKVKNKPLFFPLFLPEPEENEHARWIRNRLFILSSLTMVLSGFPIMDNKYCTGYHVKRQAFNLAL